MRDAKRLQKENEADFENTLHQERQKRLQAENALKQAELAKADSFSSEDSEYDTMIAISILKSDHASTLDGLRENLKATLDAQARQLTDDSTKKIEAVRKDLIEKNNREKAELRRLITEADTAQVGMIQSAADAKRGFELQLEKHSKNMQTVLAEQQSRLNKEATLEIAQLSETYRKEQEALEQRALRAEIELAKLMLTQKANTEKPQIAFDGTQSARSSPVQSSRPFDKSNPNLTVHRNFGCCSPTHPVSAFASDIDSVENIPPTIPTFAEIDASLSPNLDIMIHIDSSELSEALSISPSQESNVLRDRLVQQSNDRSGSSLDEIHSKPLEDPFFGYKRPLSKSQTRPNTASRMINLRGQTVPNLTMATASISTRQIHLSQHNSIELVSDRVYREAELKFPQSQSQHRSAVPKSFQKPKAGMEERESSSASPDFISETQVITPRKAYGSHASQKSSLGGRHASVESNQSLAGKKRRGSFTAHHKRARKRGRITAPAPSSQPVVPDSQPEFSQSTSQDFLGFYSRDRSQPQKIKESKSQSPPRKTLPESRSRFPMETSTAHASTALHQSRSLNRKSALAPGQMGGPKTPARRTAPNASKDKCELMSQS
jgi:hypothetical protein